MNSPTSDVSNYDVPTLERAPSGRRRLGQLLVTRGPGQGLRFELEQTLTLGRSPELGISIDDAGVSRAHATIGADTDGQFVLEDLTSRNGSYVNETRVQKRVLKNGDRIRLGPGVELEFRDFEALDPDLRERHRYEVIGRLSANLNPEIASTLSAHVKGPLQEGTAATELDASLQALSNATAHALAFTQWLATLCAGRTTRQSFDLAALVRQSGPWLERWITERVRLQLQADGVVFVHGHSADILLALLDLCADAAGTTPAGATLSVRVAASNGIGGPGATLAVAHTNFAGRPAGALASSRGPRDHDAGVALAWVREVASMHGAELRVSQEPPASVVTSLCFGDTLPADFRQASTLEAAVPAPRGKARVALLQCDPIVRRMTARLLRDAGYDVAEFGAAREALEGKLALPSELVVVDAELPDMTGATLLARLSARQPDLRGLLLDEGAPARRGGSDLPPPPFAVLHKPFTIDQLVRAIERARA